jgi:hypothetical protein
VGAVPREVSVVGAFQTTLDTNEFHTTSQILLPKPLEAYSLGATMRLSRSHALLLMAAICGCEAARPTPFLDNFRIVLDNNNNRRSASNNMRRNNSFMPSSSEDGDAKALIDKVRRGLVEKVQNNLQHYSKVEIGLYAALACALTVVVKSTFGVY